MSYGCIISSVRCSSAKFQQVLCVCFCLFLLIYIGLKFPTLSSAVHPCMKFVEFIKMLQMISSRWNMDLSDSNCMSALLDYKTDTQNKLPVYTTDAFNNNVKFHLNNIKTKGTQKVLRSRVLLPPTIIRDLQTSTRTKRKSERKPP